MTKQSSMEVVWAIRDARGLTTLEKVFLYTVASRGVAKTSRKKLMEDTGMSTGSISNVVKSLKEKGVINVWPAAKGSKNQTHYTVNVEGLTEWCSRDEHSCSGDELSCSGDELSCSSHGDKGNRKETMKVTEKVTVKTEAVADAPTSPLTQTKEDTVITTTSSLTKSKALFSALVKDEEESPRVQEMNMRQEQIARETANLTKEQMDRYRENRKMFGSGRKMNHEDALADALRFDYAPW